MDEENPETAGGARRWWLSTGGEPEGPHSESYILVSLKTGKIPESALVCPIGGREWRPLSEWPELTGHGQGPATPAPQAPLPSPGSLLTNPELPTMANWICVYALLVSPLLWCTSNLSCCFTGTGFQPESDLYGFEILLMFFAATISLAATVVLFLGGLRMRSLKTSGATMIKIGLWASLASVPVVIVFYVVLLVAADEHDFAESTTSQDIISFFCLSLGLVVYAFEIFTLVWLYRFGNHLPLKKA